MATGPEHYSQAEQLLADAFASSDTTYEGHNQEADRLIAAAQVHATLAQAAATAMASYSADGMEYAEWRTWYAAVGEESKGSDL
jgi:hypothetical protein